jgi:hypothetical protein
MEGDTEILVLVHGQDGIFGDDRFWSHLLVASARTARSGMSSKSINPSLRNSAS